MLLARKKACRNEAARDAAPAPISMSRPMERATNRPARAHLHIFAAAPSSPSSAAANSLSAVGGAPEMGQHGMACKAPDNG